MVPRCERCGHLNDRLGSTRFCDVCGAPLPRRAHTEVGAAEPPRPVPPAEEQPISAARPPEAPRGEYAPAVRGRHPEFRTSPLPATAQQPAPQPADRPIMPRPTPGAPPLPAPPRLPVARPEAGSVAHGHALEGTVIRVDPLGEEPADPDVARILASIIVIVDLLVFLGSLALVLILVTIAVAVVAALLHLPWLSQIVSSVIQLFLYILSPILVPILQRQPGARGQPRTEPVTNYLLRAADGRSYTFRIKGRLRGAAIVVRDRVRIWGRPQDGILRFRGGVKLDSGESLSLPVDWSWLLLGLVVVANIVAYATLRGRLPF